MKPYDAFAPALRVLQKLAPQRVFRYFFYLCTRYARHISLPQRDLVYSQQSGVPGILAIGITLLMISGEFDLSVELYSGGIFSRISLYNCKRCAYFTRGGNWIVQRLSARSDQRLASHIDGHSLLYYYAGNDARLSRHSAYGYFWWAHHSICRYSRESPVLEVPGLVVFILTLALFVLVLWIARDIWRASNQSIQSKILLAADASFCCLSRPPGTCSPSFDAS